MDTERLKKQFDFLIEIDKLKNIYRQTYIANNDKPSFAPDIPAIENPVPRKENDAEHSFSLALFACILSEYANEKVDVLHVIKMVLVHDAVEVYAGDTFCYDTELNKTKRERELKAADKIFGLLPDDMKAEYRGLWDEFEERATPESKFANALDRVQPLMLNCHRNGIGWKEHDVHYNQVIERTHYTADGSQELWDYILTLINSFLEDGTLPE